MRLQSLVVSLVLCGVGVGTAWSDTLTPTPASHDFMNVSVSAVSNPSQVFALLNDSGNAQVTGFTTMATMGSCADFSINAGALPIILTNNDILNVTVTYNPSDRIADVCVITTTFGTPTGDGGVFTVSGDGIAPVLNVDPAMLTFANQRWNGGAGQNLNITLNNEGDEPITSTNISAAFMVPSSNFTIGAFGGLPIAGGASGTLTVSFNPVAPAGAKSNTVIISLNNDAPAEVDESVPVGGNGTQSIQTFLPTPTLDVGSYEVGVTNGTANMVIGNSMTATDTLTLTSARITGMHATDFSFTDHGCTNQGPCTPTVVNPPIEIGDTETFAIRCSPSAVGTRSATLQITSDDPNGLDANPGTPRTVALTCTGRSPEVTVTPLTLPFGAVRVGSPSSLMFTITNASGATSADMTYSVAEAITDVTISCSPQASCMGTLIPGAVATITVTFQPTAPVARSGNIVVTTSDLDEGTVNVAMSGTGVESNMVNPVSPTFGNVPVALAGGSVQNATFGNNGGATLNTTTMTIAGDPSFSFGFGSGLCTSGTTCTRVVTAGIPNGTAAVPIRCDPASAGVKNATLNIQSDDPAPAGGTDIALTCNGTVSAMNVSPPTLGFGNQRINVTSATMNIVISNVGGAAALNYSVTEPAGDQFIVTAGSLCNPTCNNLTVPAGMMTTITVAFRPTTIGLKNGTVLIDDLDNFVTDASVSVSGTGVEPTATLTTPATLAFGNVRINTTSNQAAITVVNNGTMDLTVNSVTHTEGQAGQDNFDVAGPGPLGMSTIAMGGGSQTWNVTCDPEVRGDKTGSVTINNNSTLNPNIVVNLTCTSQEGVVQVTAAPFVVNGSNTIDFGFVRLNTSQMTTVTLTNPGNVDVTINSITLGSMTQGFSFTPPANMTLLANGAMPRTFNVIFAPTLDAQGTTPMTIDSMDWNDPVITLLGDGEPTGFACTLDAAFGNVQWDLTVQRGITLRNTGTASVNVLSVAWMSGGGEFAAIPAGTGVGALTTGMTRGFNITAIPTDAMLGTRNAILRVTTDLPMNMGQFCDVNVTYDSVGPAGTVTPGMTVDFGGVDVDAGPVTMPLQLTNSGNGILDIGVVTQPGGSYTRTDFADISLDPSQAGTLMISFDPSVEGDVNTRETRTFTINTDGLFMGSTMLAQPAIEITVTGFGIDRHIAVADVIFPDTYRNPTDAQIPTVTCGAAANEPCAIRFCNSGAARLDISMIDDPDDAFDLASTAPIMVSGGSMAAPTCTEVPVQFRPTSYGDFTGTVEIVNNDNAEPMVTIDLAGAGIPRPVDVMPDTSGMLATIALGAPVRLSDILPAGGLVLHNRSTNETFVAEVTVTPNAGNVTATLVGDDGTLAANESRTLDVEMIGSAPGMVNVVLAVHLDGDPVLHDDITVPLDVVRVDVEGGGCNAGGGGAGAGAAVLLVLLVVAWRGRGRRAVGAVVVLVAASAGTTDADVSRNIDVGTAPTSTATEPGLFDVDTPDVAPKGSWAFGIAVQHETNPMVARWTDSAMADHELGLITARTAFALGFGYAVTDKIELSARLPMYQQKSEARGMGDPFGLDGADGFALGDVGVRAKAQLVKGKVGFAGALDITAPTAKDGQFTGTDLPTAHVQGLLGIKAGARISLALNAGFLARQSTQFLLVEQGSEVTYGAALAVRVLDKVALVGEGSGALGIVGAEGKVSPIEASVGLRVRASRSATVGVGGGSGFGKGIGVADMRGFFTLTIAPGGSSIEPVRIIVPPPPRDTRDDDGDGVVNADDACATDAEDKDGFKDEDGCPEADNDDDGLLDDADKCAMEPEDKDNFQDEDGCVDRDNDADGVNDEDDKCPNEAEDKDGFNDNDGCDEPDNDNDGVPDVLDQCALEPETINGNDDEDGCPDKGDASIMLMQDRIEVLEPIQFIGVTSKLKPTAAKVLAQVGATMRSERTLRRVRVTVHVHPRGAGDEALSEKRAEEIRKWLVQWGVEPERIDAKGIGSKRPLVAKSKRGADEINDRVEFIILERGN